MMKMQFGKNLACIILSVAFYVLGASAAQATLIGVTGSGGALSTLVEVDESTGAIVNTIGSVGYAINGLTYDSVSGKLYGSARGGGGLIEINVATGAGTLIGSGFTGVVTNITSDSAGNMFGWTESGDDLVSINTITGSESVIGNGGFFTATYGLAFDSSDVLHLFNSGLPDAHFTVNTSTGVSTNVGALPNTAALGDFNDANGLYYGLGLGGNCFGICDGSMIVIDPSANAIISTFSPAKLHALAFVSTAVPEPAMLTLFGLGLAGLGWSRRKKA